MLEATAKWTEVSSGKVAPHKPIEMQLTFLRLKTQATYVQNKEDELEEKRLHCKSDPLLMQSLDAMLTRFTRVRYQSRGSFQECARTPLTLMDS